MLGERNVEQVGGFLGVLGPTVGDLVTGFWLKDDHKLTPQDNSWLMEFI